MGLLTVLLLGLGISLVSLMPQPQPRLVDFTEKLNLQEGDIRGDNIGLSRSAVLGDQYRWNGYVPYVLHRNLSMNVKGVILRAFEQIRLKTCVDFKPRTTEKDYISVESQSGCWSYIGKIGGKQQLSIGEGCGYIAIVEHEFLHSLGFFHEQSRYDRDDYVTIVTENIIAEMMNNFFQVPAQESTTQGTPYDYRSVMHYRQDAFSNGNGNTIITKDPQFQGVIGQRYDLSPTDAFELNRLYKCNSPISFLDHCSFELSLCEMATCSSTGNGWKMTNRVSGGPLNDHSNPQSTGEDSSCRGMSSAGLFFFMHFSTEGGQEGHSGVLESKKMTPQRTCHVQCLEFFYYHSGNTTDQLNIWIREYQDRSDTKGSLRLMGQITGPPTDRWQLHYVTLDASKPFQVEFEGRKGAGYSSGGFSVDDVNLSESECPHSIWQIKNFTEIWNASTPGSYMYSPLYYSPEGYRYQIILQLNSNYFSIYVRLVSGIYDEQLQWPCPWRQVTFMLLDQNPDIQKRMSIQDSLTTDPAEMFEGFYFWDKPSEVGTQVTTKDNEIVYMSFGMGFSRVVQKARLKDRDFDKGGELILLFSMQDISALQQRDSSPCPNVIVKNFNVSLNRDAQDQPCSTHECWGFFCSSANIVHPSVVLLLALVLLVVN
ncbi:meprin A subunit beta-like [Salminus brasiliensis]|uniref:meprin A subunit beta-like n=1 Tax=Salminus brasiliensis TaxID=930266 RepID=UPI003B830596